MIVITKPKCRVHGCQETIDSDKIMCPAHWARLTSKMKLQLFDILQDAYELAGSG